MSIDTTPTTTLSARVAEEIRVMMARRLIRQSELARRIGVNDQWLSVRLRGIQPIDLNDLQLIATALEVKPAELLGSTGITPRYTKPAGRTPSAPPVREDAKPIAPRMTRPPSYPSGARRPQLLNGRR